MSLLGNRDENMRRRDDEPRRDRWDGVDSNIRGEREPSRLLPSDMRRPIREEGPPRRRSRSRSPQIPRDVDQHRPGRGDEFLTVWF